jgi:putative ABC transport system permease protein
MGNFFQDIRYGLRMLRKSPGFTLIAILTLALGIGANTAIFSVADAFLLRPVSFPDTDRLVMVMDLAPGQTSDWKTVAPGNLHDWQEQASSFELLAAGQWNSFNLTGASDPQRVQGFEVSSNFLETLRVTPALGRGFLPGEDSPGRDREALLSYGLWERQFGSEKSIVGSTIHLNDQPVTIVGVMPKGFNFPPGADVWVPMAMTGVEKSSRSMHSLLVVSRLKPGVSLPQAQAEMNAISGRLESAYPKTNQGWHVRVMSVGQYVTGDMTRSYTVLLLGAVGFVLLIACANVANLQFSRSTIRKREVAVRLSLGAARWRVVRQALCESVLLGLGGALLGLPLAAWGVKLILANMPADIAKYIGGWETIAVDWRAFAFALSIAVVAGIVSGIAPAWQTASVDLNESLKEGGRSGTTDSSRHRLRSIFVVLQVTLSLVLLVGSGLMVKGVRALISLTHDFSPSTLLTLRLTLPESRYKNAQQMSAFYDRMLEQVASAPGVKSAAIATQLPFADGGDLETNVFSIEGRPVLAAADQPNAVIQYVSPGYLALMGIGVHEGRALSDDDRASTMPVAVVNQRLADKYWPHQSALGRRLRAGPDDAAGPWMTIAGVVADIRNSWASPQPEPTIYISYRQSPRRLAAVAVRTEGSPLTVVSAVRGRIAQVDAGLPLYEVMSYVEMIHQSVIGLKYVAVMLSVLGMIALILAAVGLYGVMSYLVTSRTHEIGIRMALGAQRSQVMGMTLGWGGSLVVVGTALGLAAAIVLARLLASLLYGVNAGDIGTFTLATITLAVAAFLAAFIPARRATKVDPMVALRYE